VVLIKITFYCQIKIFYFLYSFLSDRSWMHRLSNLIGQLYKLKFTWKCKK